MNPQQRELYLRYHDVVLNDNTAQTNRFNMPLNSFVVVDANAKSRLIASALLSGKTTKDYEWLLQQLLEANDHLAPTLLLLDEDPAMEAACMSQIPTTIIINCIWHLGSLNIQKNLRAVLGSAWEHFIPRFWMARNTLTTNEFEEQWSRIMNDYSAQPKITAYLKRLFDRREHWAWPWIGILFTAGMQSTQRVEKTHHLIKQTVSKMTPLVDLFKTIEQKILDEKHTSEYINYHGITGYTQPEHQITVQIFAEVKKTNARFLANFALCRMRMEMITANLYRSQDYDERVDKEDIKGFSKDNAVSYFIC